MKIALLVPAMDLGGVEQGTLDLARGFCARGHAVFVVSGPGRHVRGLREAGVAWRCLTMESRNPILFPGLAARLSGFLAAEKPGIVHARSRLPAWAARAALPASPGSRFVTSIHGFHGHRRYSSVMGRGERVIVVSEALRGHAVDFLGARPESVRVVHNGLDLSPFLALPGPGQRPPGTVGPVRVGTIGRLTDSRGHPELIEAFALLAGQWPGLELVIVGNGPREEELRARCARLGLAKRVAFARGSQLDFLPRLDILVAPFNQPETRVPGRVFWPGRSAVEAQAAGIPAVVTAAGLRPGSFEHGDDCLFVPPRDARALAAALVFLLENPGAARETGERGRKNARALFTLDRMVEETLSVYSELAEKTG